LNSLKIIGLKEKMLTKRVGIFLLSICLAIGVLFNVYFIANAQSSKAISEEKVIEISFKEEKPGDDLDRVPVAGKIINETIDETNAIIWTLSNGAKVVLKNKGRDDRIEMIALAKGGILNVDKKDIASAKFVQEFITYYYLESFKLSAFRSGGLSLSFWLKKSIHYFSGDCDITKKKYTGDLFKNLYRAFTEAEIDSKKFKAYMALEKAREIDVEIVDPYIRFLKEIKKIIYNNNPYYKDLEVSDIAKVNKKKVLKLLKKYLNPADYTFVFVGKIDVNTFKEYVETYLASIPAGKEKSTFPEDNVVPYGGQIKCRIYTNRYGFDNRTTMCFVIRKGYFQNNEIVGKVLGEYLSSIINNKHVCNDRTEKNFYLVRKVSEDYEDSGMPNFWDRDIEYKIILCSRDRNKLDENAAVVTEDIKQIAGGNINIDIFNKSKRTVKSQYRRRLQFNYYLARKYAHAAIYAKPFSAIYEQEKLYDVITPKDLQEVAAKILQEGIITITEYSKD
jgi:zinc protease